MNKDLCPDCETCQRERCILNPYPQTYETHSFLCEAPDLTKKKVPSTVKFPVSITYNGGTVIDGKWYSGYEVPEPILPPGTELVGMGMGLELNAHPPRIVAVLER